MAGEGRGLESYFATLGHDGLEARIQGLLREADRLAETLGVVVGRVSRYSPVLVEPGGVLEAEVDPQVYFGGLSPFHRVGDYLVIVDAKAETVVLARVVGVERRDLLSILASHRPADTGYSRTDPSSLATTAIVRLEPLVEAPARALAGGERVDPVPAVTSIEPQSPVVDPLPEVLERLLSLPDDGVLLGALSGPGGLVKGGLVPVRLPYKALVQHVLVIGTTGSGKTTLIKNMAVDAYQSSPARRPVMVFLDMNQDFIQLAFPPYRDQARLLHGDPVYAKHYSRHSVPRGILIVLPTPRKIVEGLGTGDWCKAAQDIFREYYWETIVPVLEVLGENTGTEPKISYTSNKDTCIVQANVLNRRLMLAPYTINTTRMDTDSLTKLMPGLSPLARGLLRRLRDPERVGFVPTLQELAAAVYAGLTALGKGHGRPEDAAAETLEAYGLDSDGDHLDRAMEVLGELRRALPHRGTLEAVYRRITSLLDTGLVDVPYGGGLAPEPSMGWIIEEADRAGVPVVVDLGWLGRLDAGDVEAPRLVAYRVLDRIRAWKHSLWAERRRDGLAGKKVIIVIDEAHQFFPQEKGPREEQEASRQVAGMISQIARLGRARGIGLLFATHSPKDLHDIILQLANTKILLRTESVQAEYLDLPGEVKQILPRLPDRNMVVLSHVYRENYVMVATSPPFSLHYDLSIF